MNGNKKYGEEITKKCDYDYPDLIYILAEFLEKRGYRGWSVLVTEGLASVKILFI